MKDKELYHWLQEMNDKDVTSDDKEYIKEEFSVLINGMQSLEAKIDLVLSNLPSYREQRR